MNKLGTPECQLFISAYYAQNKIDTNAEDWELRRKYKNFHGFTCRDFYHKILEIEAIVVAEVHEGATQLTVMENASYKVFLEEMAKKPLFYYVPAITNDGLVFYFEKALPFDARGELDPQPQKQKAYLNKKLASLFKANEVASLGVGMVVAFPLHEMEDVIQKLENNKLAFNPKLFDLLDKSLYQAIMPDISLAVFNFPEYENIQSEEAISIMFSITSKQVDLSHEEYARIKKLLKKVPLTELDSVHTIMKGFRPGDDYRLEDLVESETNRQKNKLLWQKLYRNKSRKKTKP